MRVPARLIGFAMIAVVVSVASAQFGGFGGFGKGGAKGDYFNLVNNGQVRAEIKLTEEQVAKLPAAALKALGEVLDAGQLKRLKQISLQQKGSGVYLEADVKKELKISNEQVKKIQTALDKQAEEMKEAGFDFERIQEIQKSTTDSVQGVLTADQKTTWTKMIGEPFEMKGFGGFKKKND